ncbi:MAG: ATP-binding protein [Bacteroidota bacterium]|nr:ATP-binding protein [Bacteroidota bacterium]
MNLLTIRGLAPQKQYVICIGLILCVSVVCYLGTFYIGYKLVALVLLMCVSILAMLFDILPVLLAAMLSALIWNFFFIPPIFTFQINNPEDLLMLMLYFLIALVNAVLTFQIKKAEKKAREKEEKDNTIRLYNVLLNSLSHELRTPISTILGALDTLKENKDKLSENNQNELFDQIDKASIRLNRQVENLLNMNRLETGMLKLNLDWCDTNELIHSVINKLPETHSHIFQIQPNESLPLFKYDRGLIEQVLQNIIHNAILYTPSNTIIKINSSHRSSCCIIQISDNGPGIPEHEHQLVFDKFYRLPNSKSGGSGLGLSIAKGFVMAHQGTIKLEKSEEGGAKFIIELPVEASYINHLKNE